MRITATVDTDDLAKLPSSAIPIYIYLCAFPKQRPAIVARELKRSIQTVYRAFKVLAEHKLIESRPAQLYVYNRYDVKHCNTRHTASV